MTGPLNAPRARQGISEDRRTEIAQADYEVGFGKPPRETQFKKGQSGNPTGRPRQARALKTDLLDILDIEVAVSLPSGPERMTMQRAMTLSLGAKAAKGDVRAAQAIIKLIELTAPERLRDTAETQGLDPAEKIMLARLLGEMGLDAPGGEDAVSPTAEDPADDFDFL